MESRYGRPIDFRVVDTGGAFRNKGRSRIDICVESREATRDPLVNGMLTIHVVK